MIIDKGALLSELPLQGCVCAVPHTFASFRHSATLLPFVLPHTAYVRFVCKTCFRCFR